MEWLHIGWLFQNPPPIERINQMTDAAQMSKEELIRMNTLIDLFEKQLWTFADFLNDSPNKCVPTWKYVDYILYALKTEFDEKYKNRATWKSVELDP